MTKPEYEEQQEEDLPRGEMLVYQTEDGKIRLDVRLDKESLWLTQNDMATLFACSTDNISRHLRNVYAEGELDQQGTTEEFSVIRQEGARRIKRKLFFYNLDAVISVGYRVKSFIASRASHVICLTWV